MTLESHQKDGSTSGCEREVAIDTGRETTRLDTRRAGRGRGQVNGLGPRVRVRSQMIKKRGRETVTMGPDPGQHFRGGWAPGRATVALTFPGYINGHGFYLSTKESQALCYK